MPNWNETLSELQANSQSPFDRLRLRYLEQLSEYTGRNTLVYYSGWLQRGQLRGVDFGIGDADKTGFMTCSHGVDRARGLDLILHTPGGDVAATESIIDYLHALYNGNIRAIIPQLAMSGGTLMAVSCKSIVMGKQSSIGPVDPQIGNMPAQGILEEFRRAIEQVKTEPHSVVIWKEIISKYWPTLITSCEHATNWSNDLLQNYLAKCMFAEDEPAVRADKISQVTTLLGKQETSRNHARHINPDKAKQAGLNITDLESDNKLQDIVLTIHHALLHTFSNTSAVKIIENNQGNIYATQAVAG